MSLSYKKLSELTEMVPENINETTKIVVTTGSIKSNNNLKVSDLIKNNLTTDNQYVGLSAKMGKKLQDEKAPLLSPEFTGTPKAPTQSPLDDSTNIATTSFVKAAIATIPAGGGSIGLDISSKKWCIFGDSMSNDVSTNNTGDYPSFVLTKTGMTSPSVHAVAGNTISQQLNVLNSLISANQNYLLEYDIVSLHVGINDFVYGTELGGADSELDSNTYAGKLKKFIEVVLESNPNVDLYIMTPMEANGNGVSYKAANIQGWTVSDMSKVISKICSLYSIRCIDLYNKSQFNMQTISNYTYDGLHPDGIGCDKIADVVSSAFTTRKGDSVHYKDIDYNNPITIFEKFKQPSVEVLEGWFNSDVNLGFANLSFGNYIGINLSALPRRCYLAFSILCSSDFSSSILNNAYFNYANMDNITAMNASFISADMTGAKISFAKLNGSTFNGAIMPNASFRYSSLIGCNLTYTDMTNVDLLGANISMCNFTGATGLNADINIALRDVYKLQDMTVVWTNGGTYSFNGSSFVQQPS